MKRFIFKKIDAFATTRSAGNPAGAVFLRDGEYITIRAKIGGSAVSLIEGEYILI